ncbi:MAG: response regulator [Saprospirales bacterium]|nr:response regulator [Saprospirales bacterium]MBK6903732.1 response regulator [Saprospirales bacterium]MBK7337392.1 response regulator [Saprospirales bacterium]
MKNAPLHILLADDDEGDRFLFLEAFEELKTKTIVRTLNDGVQLMDYLVKEGTLLPYLLFLDLNMPRKNGLECLKEIRSNDKLKDISIAIYSTSASEKDIEETFLNGANVYIKKPSDFNHLKEVLERAVLAANQSQEPPFSIANFLLRV